jgi:hypothetical protein
MVLKRLPLSNLDWPKPLTLDLDIKRFSPDIFPKIAPGSINHYFVHLFLVGVDDIDSYRSNTRKQIQEWLNVISKRNHEWIIVHVTQDSKRSTIFKLGTTSVFEKLKADFNNNQRRFFV